MTLTMLALNSLPQSLYTMPILISLVVPDE